MQHASSEYCTQFSSDVANKLHRHLDLQSLTTYSAEPDYIYMPIAISIESLEF